MTEVTGFRGLRFAEEKVGSLDHVVTLPYDVINPQERRTLMGRSPYNMVHVLLPEAGGGRDAYQRAADTFQAWIDAGVLRQDAEDSLYPFEQEFLGLDGTRHVRRGFFATTTLPEEGRNVILGHERTFAGPVEDRLRLTEATRANLGAIFVLYSDEENRIGPILDAAYAAEPEDTAHTMDGTTIRLWRIPDDPRVSKVFADKKLYIADGHHRFATACAYRDAMRRQHPHAGRQAYDRVLMGFVSFTDPGLLIYPPHRLLDAPEGFDAQSFLHALAEWFEVEPVENNLAARVEKAPNCQIGLAIHGAGHYVLTLHDTDRAALLGGDRGPAWCDLDVAVLHRGVLERLLGLDESTPLVYERFADRAIDAVDRGEKGLAFVLKAVRPDQLRACAEAGEPMPPKSTYFFPKLPSGAVVHRLV